MTLGLFQGSCREFICFFEYLLGCLHTCTHHRGHSAWAASAIEAVHSTNFCSTMFSSYLLMQALHS
jgi:hypothetical protein